MEFLRRTGKKVQPTVDTSRLSPIPPDAITEGQPVLYGYVSQDNKLGSQWVGKISAPHVDTLGGPDTSAFARIEKVLFDHDTTNVPQPPTRRGIEKIFPKNEKHLRNLFEITPAEHAALTSGDTDGFKALQAARPPKKGFIRKLSAEFSFENMQLAGKLFQFGFVNNIRFFVVG